MAELGEVQQREAVGVVLVMVYRFGCVFRSNRRRKGDEDLYGKLDHFGRGGEASTTTVVAIAIVETPAVLALLRRGKGVPFVVAAARVIIVSRNQVVASGALRPLPEWPVQ